MGQTQLDGLGESGEAWEPARSSAGGPGGQLGSDREAPGPRPAAGRHEPGPDAPGTAEGPGEGPPKGPTGFKKAQDAVPGRKCPYQHGHLSLIQPLQQKRR